MRAMRTGRRLAHVRDRLKAQAHRARDRGRKAGALRLAIRLSGLLLCLDPSAAGSAEAELSAPGFHDKGTDILRRASLVKNLVKDDDATAQDLVAAARADYGRLLGALYDLGHYGGAISILVDGREAADLSPVSGPEDVNRISITVDPGPRFTFSTARIAPVAPGTELPEGFRAGAPAPASIIGTAAKAGVDGWRDAGHAKADVAAQQITANHPRSQLAADIRLAPGPRLRFGDLNLTTSGKVRPERIKDIAGLPTGAVFSPEELDKSRARLRRTGAFRSVALEESETIGPGDTLDIDAALVDAKPRRVGAGIELSSLEGLTLSGFWLHRNLLGGAERLRFDGEIGGIGGDSGGVDYLAALRFDRPATWTPDTALFLEAKVQELDEPDFSESSLRVGGGFSHVFSDDLSGELGIAYQYTEIDDDFGARTLEHILLPARLTYDTRDNPLDATRGAYLGVEFTPFAGLDPSSGGSRLYADARSYLAFGPEYESVLGVRAQLGSVARAGLTEVPPGMLFFSGGAGTVRGQPYQSLAVDLDGGQRLGGRSFLGLSAELRAHLWSEWSVVGFADTGFIGQDSWGTENGDWHSGGGFGVRYDTGFGPIRVDLATPLDGDAGGDLEIYIGIGQAF